MATFYGKNNIQSTIDLMVERAKYKIHAYEFQIASDPAGIPNERQPVGIPEVRDFTFAEYAYYGRVDTRMNPIVLSSDAFLSRVKNNRSNAPVSLIDFAAIAFNDLVDES